MFESLEKRRSQGSLWTAFGVVTSLFVAAAWLWVHCDHVRARDAYRSDHEAFLREETEHREPRKVELPGMSLRTPGAGDQTGDYERGVFAGVSPIDFGVQWIRAGTIERSKVIDIVIKSYLDTHRWQLARSSSRALQVDGITAREDTLKSSDGSVVAIVTQLECGKRQVTIFAAGIGDLRAYADPMVNSFHCTPDPTIDLDRPPVVVDAAKGWTMSPTKHGSHILALRGPQGEDLRAGVFHDQGGTVADVITGAIDNTAIQLNSKPTTRNEKVFWQAINATNHDPAAVLAWRCANNDVAFITIIAPTSVDAAVAVADTGRCVDADDAIPDYR